MHHAYPRGPAGPAFHLHIGGGAAGAVAAVLWVGALRCAAGGGNTDIALPHFPRDPQLDGANGDGGDQYPPAPDLAGLHGGRLPVCRRYGLPERISQSHGGAGYFGCLLRGLLWRGPGHSAGLFPQRHYGSGLCQQPFVRGTGVCHRPAGQGKSRDNAAAGGSDDRLPVFRLHLLCEAGGRSHKPASGHHLLAYGQPLGYADERGGLCRSSDAHRSRAPAGPALAH